MSHDTLPPDESPSFHRKEERGYQREGVYVSLGRLRPTPFSSIDIPSLLVHITRKVNIRPAIWSAKNFNPGKNASGGTYKNQWWVKLFHLSVSHERSDILKKGNHQIEAWGDAFHS